MKTPSSSVLVNGEGRKRRRETGIVASKFWYWSGTREEREDRAEAMRMGRVAVSVVLFARQAERKSVVVEAGMVRERKFEVRGTEMGHPDQMLGGAWVGGEGVERGRRASRLGMSPVLGEGIVVFGKKLGLAERAARKCLWKIIPEVPSPRE